MAWTDTDAKRLKDLRTAAGLDRATFARRCTLSLAQLTELEEGGSGRFYTDQIKAHTGRTLLARLGYKEPPPPPSDPDPDPDPGQAPAAAPAPEPEPAPTPPLASIHLPPRAVHEDLFAQEPAPAAQATTLAPPGPAPVPSPAPSATPAAAAPRGPGSNSATWLSALIVVAAVAAVVFWFKPASSPPPAPSPGARSTPADTGEPAGGPVSATAFATASTASPAPSAAAAAAPAPASVASQAATKPSAPAAVTAGRCPPLSGEPTTYTPDRALRPSGYVYLEANEPATVCITDGGQRQVLATVTPAEGVTVTGTPPFTVQAADWSGLRVFFQGVRVPAESQPSGTGALQLQAR